jgi:hypothetical protein
MKNIKTVEISEIQKRKQIRQEKEAEKVAIFILIATTILIAIKYYIALGGQ